MWRARVLICLAALAILTSTAAHTQTQPARPSSVLTIDQDRLFQATRLGARAFDAIEAEARALAEENRQLEEQLLIEERDLTERRAGLTPEEFTQLADAFDVKVRALRAEQDAKARDLAAKQEESRQLFFAEIGDILSEIVNERGASVVLDRRSVFLSADSIDITDEVIARVNARASSGSGTGTSGQQ